MDKQLLTLPAARYTAPAGVLIAPQYRPLVVSGTSQVDPLEAAEPESSLRSVSSVSKEVTVLQIL